MIMSRYYILLILSLFSLSVLAQNVTNVRGMQEGTNIVLLYDLQEDTRISMVYIEIDGKSRLVPSSCLSGDVNKTVTKGQNRRIVYDVLSDYTNGLKADRIAFVINPNSEGGHEYVDLGLSVKWATCNVGASKPEEYGDYFAWGETTTKSTYNWSTYKWYNGDYDKPTKYSSYYKSRNVDKTVLDKEDDAAAVNWGGNWRMPTKEEQMELKEQCTWTWTSQNGVEGYQVKGPNGNSIFLPAAGFIIDSKIANTLYKPERVAYWSSSINTSEPSSAYNLVKCIVGQTDDSRCRGLPVRPVCGDGLKADNTATTWRVRSTQPIRATRPY